MNGIVQSPTKAHDYFASKLEFTTGPVELSRLIEGKNDVQVIDVRCAEDFAKGHVPGAKNLPEDKWQTSAGLDKEATNVFYCYSQTCHLAARAAERFASEGYRVMEMEGGFEAWRALDLPVSK